MTEDSAEKRVKDYSFLKGKNVIIDSLLYEINDVVKMQNEGVWEPYLKAYEISPNGQKQNADKVDILIDRRIVTQPSVLIHEAETLLYNDYSCIRIIEIIAELGKNIPNYAINQEVLEELRSLHQYQSMYYDPSGKDYFTEIMVFFATKMQRFK